MLLAPPDRARLDVPQLLNHVRAHFPVQYVADGYLLFVRTPVERADCAGALVRSDFRTRTFAAAFAR